MIAANGIEINTPKIPCNLIPAKNANNIHNGCKPIFLPTNLGDKIYPSISCPKKYITIKTYNFINVSELTPKNSTNKNENKAPMKGINENNPDITPNHCQLLISMIRSKTEQKTVKIATTQN